MGERSFQKSEIKTYYKAIMIVCYWHRKRKNQRKRKEIPKVKPCSCGNLICYKEPCTSVRKYIGYF
jgi:hypothetical protein